MKAKKTFNKTMMMVSALSILTACGGGGGNSGSTAPNPNLNGTVTAPTEITNGNSNQLGNFTNNSDITINRVSLSIRDGVLTNNRNINIIGNEVVGIRAHESRIENRGIININGDSSIGVNVTDESSITNNGVININSINSKGIKVSNNIDGDGGVVTNGVNGRINVIGSNSIGIDVANRFDDDGEIEIDDYYYVKNYGTIDVIGDGATGILASQAVRAENHGKINVTGAGAYGMKAVSGAVVVNSKTGVINVGALAGGGMLADGRGSVVRNEGTINISSGHEGALNPTNVALQSINGGRIENSGIINVSGNVDVLTDKDSAYVIKVDDISNYGKIYAEKIDIQGDIQADTGFIKGDYQKEYRLNDVFSGGDIKYRDENVKAESLLYSAKLVEDNGTVDLDIKRNDETIGSLIGTEASGVAKIFTHGIDSSQYYNDLSLDAKGIIDKVYENSGDIKKLGDSMRELSGDIYAETERVAREIRSEITQESYNVIKSMGEDEYQFSAITTGIKGDTLSNESEYTGYNFGFLGVKRIGERDFLLGSYMNSKYDFDNMGEGNINTLSLGIFRQYSRRDLLFTSGINGNYMFNEYERSLNSMNLDKKSKFNSYGITITNLVEKKLGDAKLYGGADLTYLASEDIDEKSVGGVSIKEKDSFESQLKIGATVKKKLDRVLLKSKVEYSYDIISDDEKERNLIGFGSLENLKGEKNQGKLKVEIGAEYETHNVTVDISVGGKSDNMYGKVGVKYKF